MKKLIVLLAGMLALAVPSFAQTIQTPISSHVISESDDSVPVASAVSTRIAASTRYAVQDNPGNAELWLDILCFRLDKLVNNPPILWIDVYYVCRSGVHHYPKALAPLHSEIGKGQLTSGSVSQIAEMLFQDFVRDTTDAALGLERQSMILDIRLFCESHKDQCSLSAGKPIPAT